MTGSATVCNNWFDVFVVTYFFYNRSVRRFFGRITIAENQGACQDCEADFGFVHGCLVLVGTIVICEKQFYKKNGRKWY